MFVRSEYNYDMAAASKASGLKCVEPTLAKQSFKEECDINTIVKRFGITGELPVNVRTPLNVDFEGVLDFKTAMDLVVQSQEAFMQMPADVRARFGNDPGRFVDFCSDKANLEEMRKLGLAVPAALTDAPAPAAAPAPSPEAPAK